MDEGEREGLTTREREHREVLEREVKKLRRANCIGKTARVSFAQAELGRRLKHGNASSATFCQLARLGSVS